MINLKLNNMIDKVTFSDSQLIFIEEAIKEYKTFLEGMYLKYPNAVEKEDTMSDINNIIAKVEHWKEERRIFSSAISKLELQN